LFQKENRADQVWRKMDFSAGSQIEREKRIGFSKKKNLKQQRGQPEGVDLDFLGEISFRGRIVLGIDKKKQGKSKC
jgi:hypothetical protein